MNSDMRVDGVGLVDRSKRLNFSFDGRSFQGLPGTPWPRR